MKLLRKLFISLGIVAILLSVGTMAFGAHALAATSTKQEVCEAIGSGPGCTGNKGGDLSGVLTTIINILSILVGFLAVLMIIVGGFKYITSGGDSNKLTTAKNTIIYALIGLFLAAIAQFMVHFVLTKASKL